MLTRHSVNAVYDLAAQVTKNNISLIPIDESPLTALLNACVSPSMASGHQVAYSNADTDLATPMTFVGASRLQNAEGASEHDLVLSELEDSISMAVANNLNWARNEVAPMIELVQNEAQAAIDAASIAGVQPYTLITYFYPDIWDREEVATMAERYSATPRQPVSLRAAIPLPDGKSVRDLLVTGIPAVDAAVEKLVEKHGIEEVDAIYNSVFGNNREATLDRQLSMNWSYIDNAVFIMLMANQLSQYPPDGINMSLDAFKSYMATIVAQAGAQVYRVMNRRIELDANHVLVIERPSAHSATGNLIVNGDVYTKWLADGGTPEIMMGAVAAGRSENYRILLEERELNTRTYQSVSDNLKSELQFTRFNALLKSFRASMTQIINSMDPESLPVPKSVLFANLTYRLTKVHQDDVADLEIPARKVVCRTLWHHTDAEKYLEAIEAAALSHPGMEIREVVLLASIDMTVEWLLGQLTLAPAH